MKQLIYALTVAIVFALGSTLTGCASKKPRTKYTDKSMRVLIDPDSIDAAHYARIQHALIKSDRFMVVDRQAGFNAIKREQELTQRKEGDRFDDKEKWSHWGKLYGVGAIIVAHAQCHRDSSFWSSNLHLKCYQRLAIMDSNTGEVIVTAEGQNEGESSADQTYIVPDWDDTVTALIDAYPKYFNPKAYEKEIVEYQELSAEVAARQNEIAMKERIAQKQAVMAPPVAQATAPVPVAAPQAIAQPAVAQTPNRAIASDVPKAETQPAQIAVDAPKLKEGVNK